MYFKYLQFIVYNDHFRYICVYLDLDKIYHNNWYIIEIYFESTLRLLYVGNLDSMFQLMYNEFEFSFFLLTMLSRLDHLHWTI